MPCTADAVRCGFSLVLLHDLATAAECETLRAEASETACAVRERMENGISLQAIAEVSIGDPESAPDQVRMPIATMLGHPSQRLCDRILQRGVERLAEELPTLLRSLFGDLFDGDAAGDGVGDGVCRPSLTRSDRLVFTQGEPACNVYTAGGQFTPHEDRQSLTILVPLSAPCAFEGGGTGFWSNEVRGPTGISGVRALELHGPPSLVVKEKRGTALVFGGDMTHSGQAVLSGERTVFVGSFSSAGGS